MKVLQTIGSLGEKQGGPSTCTYDLMHSLSDLKAPIELLTIGPVEKKDKTLGAGEPWLKLVPNDRKTPINFSRNMKEELSNSTYDLYHTNGLWIYPNHITCKCAREKGVPYIISPHGMLYPTALRISYWKKWFMLKLWFNKDILSATCLHATCLAEMEHCRAFGYKGPIAVIPNAVVFPEYIDRINKVNRCQKKTIGFLGRLHPIKKVENVLYALSHIEKEARHSISFQIMGKYDEEYEAWLKGEVKRLELEDCVEFTGFVSGEEKYERLSRLSALMVPSAQENFGMIVPEALICRTPVYASLGTPWNQLNEYNCGWWQDNNPETITKVILEIMTMTQGQLQEMGKNGRKLIEEKYEQHKVAAMMKRLYDWIIEEKMDMSTKPEFVYL